MSGVTTKRISVDGIELSAIYGEPASAAKAIIVALPGGGYTGSYWHHPLNQHASLVILGASLGFRTYAIDRPGYGFSAQTHPDGLSLDEQVTLIGTLVRQLSAASGAGVFLVGHSMGGILALRVAADRPTGLLGLDVSGVPLRYSSRIANAVAAKLEGGGESASRSAASLFYGPAGSFDPALLREDPSLRPPPLLELSDSQSWPDQFAATACRVEVPVRYTLGEYETVTETGEGALRETAALFSGSPRVEIALQAGAGHNISLHHTAGAFHLRVVAFLEEVLALRCASNI
ncbi:alpha/beta hydrolase [Novosphingobium sp. JCM 18896]|uniref:alpha/beta hydrolase n=1 Tax=Novosphingobium sp. JCM 18896 TaxID=2989731 RepID=UPI00222134DE|nr:alpha/beta fold hydrolase [Novosphingobium sp. JCM 18896]MCW1432396.1 alpha/beta fold hydrolase [Novosphingobium sp. JCM 18896]